MLCVWLHYNFAGKSQCCLKVNRAQLHSSWLGLWAAQTPAAFASESTKAILSTQNQPTKCHLRELAWNRRQQSQRVLHLQYFKTWSNTVNVIQRTTKATRKYESWGGLAQEVYLKLFSLRIQTSLPQHQPQEDWVVWKFVCLFLVQGAVTT